MTTTPTSPESGLAPEETEHVRIPAQVIRRAPGSPPPVPAPRAPEGEQAPAGLPTGDVPGLYAPPPTGKTEPLAVWSLLLGILLAPIGVITGLVALVRIKRRSANGRGLAVAGIVIGALITSVLVLAVTLSALMGLSSSSSDPMTPGGSGSGTSSDAASQTCSGSVCTVTAHGAPVTVDGIGAGGVDGLSVLAVGEGSATVASPQGPMEIPTGTALELGRGTQVVLTQAGGDTVVFVYSR